MALPKLYTMAEACEYLGKTDETIIKYVKNKKLSAIVVGRDTKFTEQQILDFLKQQTLQAKKTA